DAARYVQQAPRRDEGAHARPDRGIRFLLDGAGKLVGSHIVAAGDGNRRRRGLAQRALAALVGPVAFDADDPVPPLDAVADERADGIGGLVPAERKRRLEAVAADAAAERADIGARLDEAVVHGADAVGATDLPAR